MLSNHLVREARLRARISQAELARRLGTSQAAIARWESGKTVPSFETLRKAVRACGFDLFLMMTNPDNSYAEHIEDQLRRTPGERLGWVRHVVHQMNQLRWAAKRVG